MVVGEIRAKQAAEMPVVEDDHVVQTLAAHGADHALDVGILPRAERTRHDLVMPRLAIRRRTCAS
jgi:hypothetical protein